MRWISRYSRAETTERENLADLGRCDTMCDSVKMDEVTEAPHRNLFEDNELRLGTVDL